MYSLRHIFMLLPIFALCPLFSSAEIVIVADTESSHEIFEIYKDGTRSTHPIA